MDYFEMSRFVGLFFLVLSGGENVYLSENTQVELRP